jgi:hypothetical protein
MSHSERSEVQVCGGAWGPPSVERDSVERGSLRNPKSEIGTLISFGEVAGWPAGFAGSLPFCGDGICGGDPDGDDSSFSSSKLLGVWKLHRLHLQSSGLLRQFA